MHDKELVIEKLEGLKNLLDEKFENNDKAHQDIMIKQDHTNGDVSNLKLWRAYITGGLAVVTFMVSALIALIIKYITIS